MSHLMVYMGYYFVISLHWSHSIVMYVDILIWTCKCPTFIDYKG